jgi:adenylate cyclase
MKGFLPWVRLKASWRKVLLLPLLATASLAALYEVEALGLQQADRVVYDYLLRTFSPKASPAPDVVVIALDDRTLQELKGHRDYGSWPYQRALWARLLEQLEREGARAVVFDMVFDEDHADPSGDVAFGEALEERSLPVFAGFSMSGSALDFAKKKRPAEPPSPGASPPAQAPEELDFEQFESEVVLPTFSPQEVVAKIAFDVKSSQLPLLELCASTDVPDRRCEGRPRAPIPPLSSLLARMRGWGYVAPETDPDGVMRRTRFAYRAGEDTYVTLATRAAAGLLGAQRVVLEPGLLTLGQRRVRIGRDGTAMLDYRGPFTQRFSIVSLVDVLSDWEREDRLLRPEDYPQGLPLHRRVPARFFQEKVVFVAGTGLGTADQKPTPFEAITAGVVKPATELQALLSGRFVIEAPRWHGYVLAFAVALLFAAALMVARSWVLETAWPFLLALLVVPGLGLILVEGQVYLSAVLTAGAGGLSSIGAAALNHLFASKDREKVKARLSPFLDRKIVERLVESEEGPTLGQGAYSEVTAFFSDIRGFSTFSEAYRDDPKTLMGILNRYLTAVSGVLLQFGGVLDNYIGDAVVGLFGAPVKDADHAVHACWAALAVQDEVRKLREEFRQKGLPDVYTRIGLNSAVLFVGNFGSEQLYRYTAMGDGMNLAARLEGANKAYETSIMIGQRTWELAHDHIEWRELDRVRVAGKHEPVAVYEVLARPGQLPREKREVVNRYHAALALYRAAKFGEAVALLEEALGIDPEDGPAKALAGRCRKFLEHPPPMPFEGVISLDK